MKKLRNLMFVFLLLMAVICVTLCLLFNHYTSPVGGSSDAIKVEIGGNGTQIAESLKKADLIRSTTFFKIYLKLFNINDLKAGKYSLNKEMSLKEIVDKLKEGNHFSEEEISITFKEGITMRGVATAIANNTNNTFDDVMNVFKDTEYLKSLINDYWFITDKILDSKIYYPLEGYLFPDTYRFASKDVTVKEIFTKLLDQMDKVLAPLKADIEGNKLDVHEILTLSSIIEKEVRNNEEYRKKAASVFENRMKRGMSLGSDVTTYYALKIDNAQTYINEKCGGKNCINYKVSSPYNTRLTDGTMNGKLPVGPISTISEGSIKAVLYHDKTDYIYFISNIKTGEMFFYTNAREFEAKKVELSKVNGGL